MQQFIVPQFIDVEDKIIGPVTTRQFIIMLAGFIIIGISYKIFDFSLFVTFGILVIIITGVIAFLKINGRPFHYFILNLFQTLRRPKLRIWHNFLAKSKTETGIEESSFLKVAQPILEKRYTTSRLAELSLIVDTKGAYQGENIDTGMENVAR
jgi:hypothetical protein